MRSLDYRAAMNATGEIEVGARAVRRFRRRMAAALLGVTLVGAALLLYFTLRGQSPAGGDEYEADLRCITCSLTQTRRIRAGTEDTLMCPKCGQRSLKVVWACRQCGWQFVPAGSADFVRCPKCRSSAVGSAAAARRDAAAPPGPTTQPKP
ncbi:MAG: hypothetical protein CHACPFDD_03478 [Phycisphaerae bacterium]|nr:hypothetical protein [Phycisphaerae bacterium]